MSLTTELDKMEKSLLKEGSTVYVRTLGNELEHQAINVIYNMAGLEKQYAVSDLKMELEYKSILARVLNQVIVPLDSKFYIIVEAQYYEVVKSIVDKMVSSNEIRYMKINNSFEHQITQKMLLNTNDEQTILESFEEFLNLKGSSEEIDNTLSSVLINTNSFNVHKKIDLQLCGESSLIQHCNTQTNKSHNAMIFKLADCNNIKSLKKISISDYGFNIVDLSEFKSIVDCSLNNVLNRSVYLRYVYKLLGHFEFEEALKIIKKMSTTGLNWELLYIEFLLGYGLEEQFEEYYNANKQVLNSREYTITQRRLNANELDAIDMLNNDQVVFIADINQYISDEINVSVQYILEVISRKKYKLANLSNLVNKLISADRLTASDAELIIDEIVKCNPSPFFLKRNVISIYDYFMMRNQAANIPVVFIQKLFSKLLMHPELFKAGIELRMKYFKTLISLENQTLKISNNPKSRNNTPRIAISITGLAKHNFEKNLMSIKHFFRDLDCDYFVQSWDKFEVYPGIANVKADNDLLWSKEYLSKVQKALPSFIARKGNFEALFPNVSKLLFTSRFDDVDVVKYKEVLGDRLKSLNLCIYDEFVSKYSKDKPNLDTWNAQVTKAYELGIVQKQIDKYQQKINTVYDYQICLDVNVALRSKIELSSLVALNDNEVYTIADEQLVFNNALLVGKFDTVRQIQNFWNVSVENQSIIPYLIDGSKVKDYYQNQILLHMIKNNITPFCDNNRFGNPYLSKKVELPNFDSQLKTDMEKLDIETDKCEKYFAEVKKHFVKPVSNSDNYLLIDEVSLVRSTLGEEGVRLEISIKGNSLSKIWKPHLSLQLSANVDLNSNCSNYKQHRESLTVKKNEDDEVVVEAIISDRILVHGKNWYPRLLLNEYTPMYMEIETGSAVDQFEYSRYGMKFIQSEGCLKIGIDTKNFMLTQFTR